VAVTRKKAQRQCYVPKSQLEAVRAGVAQYHRLLAIVDRISSINLQLMRAGKLDESV